MKKNIIIGIVAAIVVIGFGVYAWDIKQEGSSPPAQSPESSPPPAAQPVNPPVVKSAKPTTQNMQHLITLKTSLGDIQFTTYDADAPKTVQNFITLSQKGFYNNAIFHRVIKGFMIQGGDPQGTGFGGPGYTFADEINPQSPIYQAGYKQGIVAMANSGPNTNGSQFFIMLADYPLPPNYTIFGKVTKGQDVVNAIGNLPTGAADRPLTPPAIKSVLVEESK